MKTSSTDLFQNNVIYLKLPNSTLKVVKMVSFMLCILNHNFFWGGSSVKEDRHRRTHTLEISENANLQRQKVGLGMDIESDCEWAQYFYIVMMALQLHKLIKNH